MNLINDDFPIEEGGILEIEFLTSDLCTLSLENNELRINENPFKSILFIYHSNIYLPARSKRVVSIKLKNDTPDSTDVVYIPRIKTGSGVYLGECLAKSSNGLVNIFGFNTTTQEIDLIIPPIEDEEFEPVNRTARTIKTT